MYLFMASRRQLIGEVIAPALAAGQVVIADRYHDSTLAYQGGARGLPTVWPPTFPRPDITFLLEGPVEAGLGRHEAAGKSKDRMEQESIDFHRKVAEEYDRLAGAEPKRFVRLDAKVHAAHSRHVTETLEEAFDADQRCKPRSGGRLKSSRTSPPAPQKPSRPRPAPRPGTP